MRVILISSTSVLGIISLITVGMYFISGTLFELWDRILLAFVIFLIAYIFILNKKGYISRYLLVGALFAFGVRETFLFGLSNVFVLYYVVTLIVGFMLLNRRFLLILNVLFLPPLIDLIFYHHGVLNFGTYISYIGLQSTFSLFFIAFIRTQESFEHERQRMLEVEAVRKAGASVASSLDLQETIQKILNGLKNIIPHDSASVLLMSEDNCLEIVGGSGWDNPEDVIGLRFPIPGSNPNSVVVQEGRPHILGNAPVVYPTFNENPHNHIKSWLGVPLINNGKIIGMMAIDSKEENYFSEHHIHTVTAFADHVAVAIENSLLFQVSTEAIKRRLVLYQTSQDMIRASADPEEIFSAIHRAASKLMPCEAFVISLLDKTKENIEGVYMIDKGGRIKNQIFSREMGLSGKIINNGKSELFEDINNETSFEGQHFGHKDRVRSLIAVPLASGGEIIGMLSAQSYQISAYNQEDLEILELLAAQAAIAIKNTQLLAEMERVARTDSLTGLLNRRAFDEQLTNEIERARRYNYSISLVMIDVDDFKQFNSLYGHHAGDIHLKKIASLILKSTRMPDQVSRIGGEEFSVILPHTIKAGGYELAERIRATIAEEFIERDDPACSVSIGIAEFPQDAENLQTLYNLADRAMFIAKNLGKNRVIIANEIGEQA
ncbi:diguanylate cyclase [bacterium]|nr:diguanylate cyclase [bacterium]MCB2179114.1 diguanylate cyclase [bacterium]